MNDTKPIKLFAAQLALFASVFVLSIIVNNIFGINVYLPMMFVYMFLYLQHVCKYQDVTKVSVQLAELVGLQPSQEIGLVVTEEGNLDVSLYLEEEEQVEDTEDGDEEEHICEICGAAINVNADIHTSICYACLYKELASDVIMLMKDGTKLLLDINTGIIYSTDPDEAYYSGDAADETIFKVETPKVKGRFKNLRIVMAIPEILYDNIPLELQGKITPERK